MQRPFQDDGEWWYIAGVDQSWFRLPLGVDPVASVRAERASLRQDLIWLETQQYLGVVLRDATADTAIDALSYAYHTRSG